MDSEQYNSANRTGGGSATRTPEAQGLDLYTPGHTRTLTWTSPLTSRLLLEAGWGSYLANYANDAPRIDGLHNPAADFGPRTGTGVPERRHRRTDLPVRQSARRRIPASSDRHAGQPQASISYVTGAHNMKFGYMGGFSNPSQSYYNFTPFVQYRFADGVPNQLTQTAQLRRHRRLGRRVRPQPRADVVLRAGSVDQQPADAAGRPALRPHPHQLSRLLRRRARLPADAEADLLPRPLDRRRPLERPDAAHWRRLRSVRQRQDRVKFNIGKYMQALTASNSDMDLNPLIR